MKGGEKMSSFANSKIVADSKERVVCVKIFYLLRLNIFAYRVHILHTVQMLHRLLANGMRTESVCSES